MFRLPRKTNPDCPDHLRKQTLISQITQERKPRLPRLPKNATQIAQITWESKPRLPRLPRKTHPYCRRMHRASIQRLQHSQVDQTPPPRRSAGQPATDLVPVRREVWTPPTRGRRFADEQDPLPLADDPGGYIFLPRLFHNLFQIYAYTASS